MRADRLVAILLMLQAKGRITAADVAEELEVSERTARRDLEALGMAGLPVYSTQGRNGGWQLAGGGRTDLSGLSAAEARALFLVAGPSSSATPELRAALRKLVRALPESFRDEAQAAWSAVVVDQRSWDGPTRTRPAPPLLDAVQTAVVEGRQIELDYVARDGTPSTRVVHPLGVAAKGTIWYLVANTEAGLRTFRIDRMRAITVTDDRVERPAGFDLNDAWKLITDEVDQLRTPLHVRASVDPDFVGLCRMIFGSRLRIGPTDDKGRVEMEIRGHSAAAMAGEIAGLGRGVEVFEPPEVRAELARVGAELLAVYG